MNNLKEDELIFIKILLHDELTRLNILRDHALCVKMFDETYRERIELVKSIYNKLNE